MSHVISGICFRFCFPLAPCFSVDFCISCEVFFFLSLDRPVHVFELAWLPRLHPTERTLAKLRDAAERLFFSSTGGNRQSNNSLERIVKSCKNLTCCSSSNATAAPYVLPVIAASPIRHLSYRCSLILYPDPTA
jgi:hypothetical protein